MTGTVNHRKRKYDAIELEVHRKRFIYAPFGARLLDLIPELREAFENVAYEWEGKEYTARLTAEPRAPDPIHVRPSAAELSQVFDVDVHKPIECVACMASYCTLYSISTNGNEIGTEDCHPCEARTLHYCCNTE